MFLLLNNNRSDDSSRTAMRACRKLNHPYDEEDLVEMACPYFLLSRCDFFVNKGIRTSIVVLDCQTHTLLCP